MVAAAWRGFVSNSWLSCTWFDCWKLSETKQFWW